MNQSYSTWENSNKGSKLAQSSLWNNAVSGACVFKWHKRFKERREEVEDDLRSGKLQPAELMKNIELVRKKVHGNCQLTV